MIVYLGQYISEKIRESRGLPTLNAAGSNRMLRIAEAIQSVQQRCVILTPGITGRIRWKGKLFHKSALTRSGTIPICFAPALGVPFLSAVWAPVATLITLFVLKKRHGLKGVVVYNYRSVEFLVAFISRYLFKVPVLLDFEDVSMPRWEDWRVGAAASAFQQLRFWPLMKATICVCNAVFVPTRKFLHVVPQKKMFEVISGCMRVCKSGEDALPKKSERISDINPLVLLFSGKIEFEHGVDVLAEAIHLLDQEPNGAHYEFHVCGGGPELNWLKKELESLRKVRAYIHGFVSNQEFSERFQSAEVCIVLQKPQGRNAYYKTPSKGYEALCAGKALLVSDIGDFSELPAKVCQIISPLTGETLAHKIKLLTRDEVRKYATNAHKYALENWDSPICGSKIMSMMEACRSTNRSTSQP